MKRTDIARLVALLQRQTLIRSRDLRDLEIDRKALARALGTGLVERRGRGLYTLAGAQQPHHLAEACKRVPGGVICLLSALHLHGLISEEPPEVWMAIDRKAWLPRVDWPSLRFVRFSGAALKQGFVNMKLGSVPIRVYSPMKSIADCYRYRNKIGREIGPAALATSIARGTYNRKRLLHFATICRVEKLVAEVPTQAHARKLARAADSELTK